MSNILRCTLRLVGHFRTPYGNIPQNTTVESQILFVIDQSRNLDSDSAQGLYEQLTDMDESIVLTIDAHESIPVNGGQSISVPKESYTQHFRDIQIFPLRERTSVGTTSSLDVAIGGIDQSNATNVLGGFISVTTQAHGNVQVPDTREAWVSYQDSRLNSIFLANEDGSNNTVSPIRHKCIDAVCEYLN